MKKLKANSRLISHIFILATVFVIAVAATFSWYNRSQSPLGSGSTLAYSQSGKINGTGGTVTTYVGTDDNGKITYDTPLTSAESLTAEPGTINYFKSVISDNSTTSADSVVSLYLEDLSYGSSLGDTLHIGLYKPEKLYRTFTAHNSGDSYIADSIKLEDNLVIKKGGTLEVYWFIEIDGSASSSEAADISLGSLHLVYN